MILRRKRYEERNRQAGIASHTARIAECEANLEEAIAWEQEHPDALLKGIGTRIWTNELEHSRSMLAMYQDEGRYAASRRYGFVVS